MIRRRQSEQVRLCAPPVAWQWCFIALLLIPCKGYFSCGLNLSSSRWTHASSICDLRWPYLATVLVARVWIRYARKWGLGPDQQNPMMMRPTYTHSEGWDCQHHATNRSPACIHSNPSFSCCCQCMWPRTLQGCCRMCTPIFGGSM